MDHQDSYGCRECSNGHNNRPGFPRMGNILVGTTSWTEKTLIDSGLFYPPGVKTPEDRLKYYATQFPVTEVDSSYYSLPSERNAAAWVERTPKSFVFHV